MKLLPVLGISAAIVVVSLITPLAVSAEELVIPYTNATTEDFQMYALLAVPTLSVPTVIQAELGTSRSTLATYIYDATEDRFVGSRDVEVSDPIAGSASFYMPGKDLVDASHVLTDSNKTLDLPPDPDGYNQLTFTFDEFQAVEGIRFNFATNSASPERVTIAKVASRNESDNSASTMIRNDLRWTSSQVSFPVTTANQLIVSFKNSQPLRLRSVDVIRQVEAPRLAAQFVAKPGHRYVAYSQLSPLMIVSADEEISAAVTNPVRVTATFQANPVYREPDQDSDGRLDSDDNCPTTANPDQEDLNRNLVGDACEDFDADGVAASRDNCPNDPNAGQIDTDDDGMGDACDKLDNRITEQFGWLPWLGIGVVAIVLVAVLVATFKTPTTLNSDKLDDESPQ